MAAHLTTVEKYALGLGLLAACAAPAPRAAAEDDVVLTGMARDFLSSHPDFGEPVADQGDGHYAGNVSQILGSDLAPLQVHGVSDFEITYGTLVPGVPYAARLSVLGSQITSGGDPIPVTLQAETDTQLFQPFGLYNDPGGEGNLNDGANPRHFIFSLDEVYSAETPISVTATSWLPDFAVENFGNDAAYSKSGTDAEDAQVATLVTLPEDGTVTSICAYLYRDSGGSAAFRYAIYENSGGEPGDLIVESSRSYQSSGWTWESVDIPDTPLAAGNYWLSVALEDDGDLRYRYDSNSGQMRRLDFEGVDGSAPTWGASSGSWNSRKVSVYATYTADEATYAPHLTARSGDNSPYVLVLKDGDSVPSIPAFQDQTNLAYFVEPYVNTATGKVVLQDNQAIYLFELGTTNLSSSAADFQDLVIMITLATDPVYFFTPDVESEGLDPIGYKVNSEWTDEDGNMIAPHLYEPGLGDHAGIAGPTSSGGVTSPATFYQWHRDILGVNLSMPVDITLEQKGEYYEFKDADFHPVDGLLYGNEGTGHNDDFTYSVYAYFTYDASARQWFEMKGGDGAWLFVDGKLLIDLGGVDSNVTQYGAVDRLGLVDGQKYMVSLFYANRGKDAKFEFRTNVFLSPGPLIGQVTSSFD
jgi:fibro-slime domain-containing protein